MTAPALGGLSTAAKKRQFTANRLTINASANAQFMSTSMQPQVWMGALFNPKLQPQKLQGEDHATLLQQNRC